MGRKKAVALCVAFVFGSVFAVAVSSWEERRRLPADDQSETLEPATAQSEDRQPEFMASQPQADESAVTPASYETPGSNPLAIGVPGLLPPDATPAEQMPAELAPEQPAPSADDAPANSDQPAPVDEPAGNEASGGEAPTDRALAAEPETPAIDEDSVQASPERPDSPTSAWHNDYGQAMDAAMEQQRMLFVYFFDPRQPETQQTFEQQSLAEPRNREILAGEYVAAKLPIDTVIPMGGKPTELLNHPAFAEMLGRPGVAILDFAHPGQEFYGHVVSTFPFVSGRYYSKPVLATVLSLPPGTLTQRTMIYAVRIHPEAPASTQGQFNNVLADEANRHSIHQAAILVQGHHNWDSRFHRINTRLPSGVLAQEVVAESWPSENLVDACVDCVDSWRHSPGHWEAVRTRHPLFGFDIHRGRNGIWYATGIFGHR